MSWELSCCSACFWLHLLLESRFTGHNVILTAGIGWHCTFNSSLPWLLHLQRCSVISVAKFLGESDSNPRSTEEGIRIRSWHLHEPVSFSALVFWKLMKLSCLHWIINIKCIWGPHSAAFQQLLTGSWAQMILCDASRVTPLHALHNSHWWISLNDVTCHTRYYAMNNISNNISWTKALVKSACTLLHNDVKLHLSWSVPLF